MLAAAFFIVEPHRASGQDSPASHVGPSAPIPYPPAARKAGIEGEVRYRAAIGSDGSVESIALLSVPAADLGFEEAARAAISGWRFVPAMRDGAPVASEFSGTLRFTLTIPGEWMYPVSSRDAWRHLRDLAKTLGFRTERADDQHQLLISTSSDANRLPDAKALGLPSGFRLTSVELTMTVAPGLEPARVAIGSTMTIDHIDPARRLQYIEYGNERLAEWIARQISLQTGVAGESLAVSPERRAEQTSRLMPPGLQDRCAIRPARLGANDARPQSISRQKLLYPKEQFDARRNGTVMLQGEVTEHGKIVKIKHLKPADAPEDFQLAAQLAASLWRFQPVIVSGCPVRSVVTLSMFFRIQ